MFTEARALKFSKYFYSQRGPILDYSDITLVNFFFKSLATYLKQHNCLYVLLDPCILENLRNAFGSILDLAAAIYIYNDYELYYLSSSSNPTYNAYMGAYKLQ